MMANPDRIPIETVPAADHPAGLALGAAPVRIGDLEVANPVWMAPMAHYTNSAARTIAKRFGAGLVYTEMIAAPHFVHSGRQYADVATYEEEERPIGAQMAPLSPADAGEAARIFTDMGFDMIEINMACPAPKIVKRGRGGGLLRDHRLACDIAAAVAERTDRPVTVKVRSGWDAEDGFTSIDLGPALVEAGADAIVLHARYVKQLYKGPSNWLHIADMVDACPAPVIGSGDLSDGAAAVRMLRETRCAAVTLARGAVGNPWAFPEALARLSGDPPPEPPTRDEVLAVMAEHCRLSAERGSWPREYHTLRRTLPKYARKMPGPSKPLSRELGDTRTREEWVAFKEKWGLA